MIPETIESIKNFLETLNKIENNWDSVYEEIGRSDLEISDLIHEVELTDFDPVEGIHLAEEIKKARRHRRELKDYQEVIRHMKEYLDRNKSLKINLFKVLTAMERTREAQCNRTYTPRVRTDLKLCSRENQLNSKGEAAKDNNEVEVENKTESYSSADLPVNLDDVHELIEQDTKDTEESASENDFLDDGEVIGDDGLLPCRGQEKEETRQQKEKAAETT
ncbi:hypothetical protein [Bacillus atrophaeus]|uniref:hypothetical protein n=1 Tax=Bacillus atrophaeus TaxID=1452 RepID=UPI002E1EAF73|nr:hypothetical protein [Bacillus atrophaeus]